MIAKALLGVILALTVAGGVQTFRLAGAERDAEHAKRELAEAIASWDRERVRQLDAAREREKQHADELHAIAAEYEQERANADAEKARVVSDLRTGAVRLRKLWQGCEAAAGSVPGASESAGEPDAFAELRRQGAGDLVRLAEQCDAHVRGLQGVIHGR
jgi:hypothetical protein